MTTMNSLVNNTNGNNNNDGDGSAELKTEPSKIFSSIRAVNDLARRYRLLAEYTLEKECGPGHAKMFTVRLRLGTGNYVGTDRSIKQAQRVAAQAALADFNNSHERMPKQQQQQQQQMMMMITSEKDLAMPSKAPSAMTPTVALNTWAQRYHVPTQYVLLSEQPVSPVLPYSPYPRMCFYYRLHVGSNLWFDAQGFTQLQARTNCALHALAYIQENMYVPPTPPQQQLVAPSKSSISLVYERAKKIGSAVTYDYDKVAQTGTLKVGDTLEAKGTGPSQKAAKTAAADKMLELMPMPEVEVEPSPVVSNNRRAPSNSTRTHRQFVAQRASYVSPVQRLYQVARAMEKTVVFREGDKQIEEANNNTNKLFLFFVQLTDKQQQQEQPVNGETLPTTTYEKFEGKAKSKQGAKQAASIALLRSLGIHDYDEEEKVEESVVVTVLPLPPPPAKGLLKKQDSNGGNEVTQKKRVSFSDLLPADDSDSDEEDEVQEFEDGKENEQDKVQVLKAKKTKQQRGGGLASNKTQLLNSCQPLNIIVEFRDQLGPPDASPSSRHHSVLSLWYYPDTHVHLLAQFRGSGPSPTRAQENASVSALSNLQQLFTGQVKLQGQGQQNNNNNNNNNNHRRRGGRGGVRGRGGNSNNRSRGSGARHPVQQ